MGRSADRWDNPQLMSTPVLDPEIIAARSATLDRAQAQLHARFVWIDRVIDDLCGAVRMWYVAPELLSRPVIVNLWE